MLSRQLPATTLPSPTRGEGIAAVSALPPLANARRGSTSDNTVPPRQTSETRLPVWTASYADAATVPARPR